MGKDAGGHGSEARGARQERVAMNRAVDERHFPTHTVTDRMAAASLGQAHPKTAPVPLGQSFAAAKSDLSRGRSVALPAGAENRRQS